jgi:hypothetical protein
MSLIDCVILVKWQAISIEENALLCISYSNKIQLQAMNIIPKIVWKENHLCTSTSTPDDLKSTIEAALKGSESWGVNLAGSFYAPSAFQLTPRWQLLMLQGFENWYAYLNGEILQQDGKTFVRFTVRPNITFTFVFFTLPIITILIFIGTGRVETTPNALIAEGIILIGVPLLMLLACIISKRLIRKRFVQAFDLQEIP